MSSKNENGFIDIINCCLLNSNVLLNKISTKENFLERLIDIKKIHRKLNKELEEYLISPHYDLYEENGLVKGKKYLRNLYIDIKSICNELGIDVFFTKKETLEFKKRIFAYYRLGDADISCLIYSNEKKKQKKVEDDNLDGLDI